jgi:hypothetical protein
VHADITLEIVVLGTPNNVVTFIRDATAKGAKRYILFHAGQVFHFPILSHGLSQNTISNAPIRALQSVKERKKRYAVLPTEFPSM